MVESGTATLRGHRPKVTIVGAGMVGGATAQFLAQRNYADIVLLDIVDGLPQGKALDIQEAAPLLGYETQVLGTTSYSDTANSEVVVITSGIARKPGMSRDDLLKTNAGIVASVAKQIADVSPDTILVVVSNPLDAMCHVAMDASGFPRERVLGQAGVLDSARFRTFIAAECGVSVRDVSAFVLGGHGDTMVPLSRYSTVNGVPITEMLTEDRVKALETRTANGGAEIVSLLKSGSAYAAPGAAVVEMVDAILLDQRRIVPCSVYLTGEYGIDGLFVGVPVILGRNGLESVVAFTLKDAEQRMLHDSSNAVRSLVADLARLNSAPEGH